MTGASEARQGELDGVLTSAQLSPVVADDLFAASDALNSSPPLRRALTDPGAGVPARVKLARDVFAGKVSEAAMSLIEAAVGLSWPGGRSLEIALERQGVRAVLALANQGGRLTELEAELFRFGRLVEAEDALRGALADQRIPAANRQQLVSDLLKGKALEETTKLSRRAVLAKDRTFALTIEHYLALAAALRNREVAVVYVARELTPEQSERLRASLARLAGREVNLEVIVDAGVGGGVRVEWADEVIEGTIAGRLVDARRKLT